MANHCSVVIELHVFGEDRKKVVDFLNTYKTHKGTFVEWVETFLPEHLRIPNTGEEYPDFYKYGTKWFEFTINETFEDEPLTIVGYSAWSPPIAMVTQISKMFECKAYIQYEESGIDFAGHIEMVSGIETEKVEMGYLEYLYEYAKDQFNSKIDMYVDDIALENENSESPVEKPIFDAMYYLDFFSDVDEVLELASEYEDIDWSKAIEYVKNKVA